MSSTMMKYLYFTVSQSSFGFCSRYLVLLGWRKDALYHSHKKVITYSITNYNARADTSLYTDMSAVTQKQNGVGTGNKKCKNMDKNRCPFS